MKAGHSFTIEPMINQGELMLTIELLGFGKIEFRHYFSEEALEKVRVETSCNLF